MLLWACIDLELYPKTKLLSMISSNKNWTDGHNLRVNMMRYLMDKADVFGNQVRPIATKEDGLRDYMFSVAIENSSYETYFTEKIIDCFATGTIPIYWGAPDIGDHFNSDGIISLEDIEDIDIIPGFKKGSKFRSWVKLDINQKSPNKP